VSRPPQLHVLQKRKRPRAAERVPARFPKGHRCLVTHAKMGKRIVVDGFFPSSAYVGCDGNHNVLLSTDVVNLTS
jgi:hypothetical protein